MYMRSDTIRRRAVALLIGFLLAVVATTLCNAVYWNRRIDPWMRRGPSYWPEISARCIGFFLVWLTIMFAPVMLAIIRRIRLLLQPTNVTNKAHPSP